MILPDVNVLVYAHRKDAPDHDAYAEWLTTAIEGPAPFGYAELVLSGVVRVVTNPKVFRDPSPVDRALAFCGQIVKHPNAVVVRPGARHWTIFHELCTATKARGKLVAGAYHASLAIEHGCEWITTDADFGRFPNLTARHPLRA